MILSQKLAATPALVLVAFVATLSDAGATEQAKERQVASNTRQDSRQAATHVSGNDKSRSARCLRNGRAAARGDSVSRDGLIPVRLATYPTKQLLIENEASRGTG